MRSRWLSLTALLVGSAMALAQPPGIQQPPPPKMPALDPINNQLDAVLLRWENAMSNINTLWASVRRTDVNKVFNTTDVLEGEAKYVKPNKALLHLVNKDPKKSQEFEKLVCNGQTAYVWEPSKKQIQIFELPKPQQGQIKDDNFVRMLFGLKAIEAKQLYTLTLGTPDQNYNYIMIEPRAPQDKAEFTKARLALLQSNFLPAQIWFEQPNGNQKTWDFPRMAINQALDAREFGQPQPPAGWQLQKAMQK